MKAFRYILVAIAVFATVTGMMVCSSSETSADNDYIVYYVIQDERLPGETFSIDCEGIYATNTYVFFKSVTGDSYTTLGTLPATENIVSRYVDSDLSDYGFVLNPEGDDVSGWFTEPSFENKVNSRSRLSALDTDHDGIVYLYMKAARWYNVHYEARNFDTEGVTASLWFDGYYMEKNRQTLDSRYNENRFEEVDYVIRLIEGQTIPALPNAGIMFSSDSNIPAYLALSLQSAPKDTSFYDLDRHVISGHEVYWFLRENTYYPNVDEQHCTPIYPGLVVDDSMDTDHDGEIVLYGTSTKTDGSMSFFLYLTFAMDDLQRRSWGQDNYNGETETICARVDAKRNPPNVVQEGTFVMDIPEFAGFTFNPNQQGSWGRYVTGSSHNMDADVTFSNGKISISNATIHQSANSGSLGVYFIYHRQSVNITVTDDEGPHVLPAYYGCDLQLPSEFGEHMLYEWQVSGLSDSVWSSAGEYYYTVSLDDLDAVNPSITATWQEGVQDTVYTIQYVSRVQDQEVIIAPGVVTNDGSITLPMISFEGYSHLGWAMVDPNEIIDFDTTTLVIYPGRTSLVPASISSQYKEVNPQHPNLITIHLYAVWCTTYTISFNANGGEGSMDPLGPVKVDEYVSLTANTFTRNNYEFAGWSMSPDGSVAYADMASVIGLSTQSHGSVTLYAVWSSNTNYIVYDGNNATSGTMLAQTVRSGDPVTLTLNDFSRTGYSFLGWSITSGSSVVTYSDGATFTPASTVSLYAVWSPITYYVVFDGNNSTGGSMDTMTFRYDEMKALTSNAFVKDGSTFNGWSCSDGNTYSNGYMVKNLTAIDGATVTMYAIWAQYYIEFHANNGTGNYDRITVSTDIYYTIPDCQFTAPQTEDIFVHWNTRADGTGTSYAAGTSVRNLAATGETAQLYAIWDSYVYYVAFDANGGTGSMGTVTVHGSESITLTNQFAYAQRYFLGWSKNPLATVATYSNGQIVSNIGTGENGETITLYALWSEQMVVVTVSQLKYVENDVVETLQDISGPDAFGIDRSILSGDNVRLSLGTLYSGYSEYRYTGGTFYLSSWTYTIDGVDYSAAYGSTLFIPEGVSEITITAHYMEFRGYFRYNANNGTATAPVVTVIGLERVNDTYVATANLSDSPFTFDGYEFCMWSRSANSISDASKAGTLYRYSSDSAEVYYDFYAVWIKIDTETSYYAGGEAVEADYTVTAKYGSTETVLTPATVVYQNNINVGTATMTVTLNVTYLGGTFSKAFTIEPGQVTITVDDDSKTYGESDPDHFTGTVYCPTAANPDITVTYTRVAGENVGEYDITASFTSPNYVLYVLNKGTFTIVPAAVTISVNDAQKNYGTDDPAFTGVVTCSTSYDVLSITYYRTNPLVEDIGVYTDVITASWTPNANYIVTLLNNGTFTILEASEDTVYFIILDGRGGGATYTEESSVASGTPFPAKTVAPNSGYSFQEWLRVTYSGGRIVAVTHMTYSNTLPSAMMSADETYMAVFVTGDSISFNGNGGTGSMSAQAFTDRSGTVSPNTFEKEGSLFLGWSLTSDGDVAYTDMTPLSRINGLSTTGSQNVLYAVWAQYTYTSVLDWNPENGRNQQMGSSEPDQQNSVARPFIDISAPAVNSEDLDLILKAGAFAATMLTLAAIMTIRRRQ